MAIPLILMAAGTALQVIGQYQANMDQAQAELQNAQFYQRQADFAKQAEYRAASLANREYSYRKGAQISAYAKGGVDLSGSASSVVAETAAQKIEELNAIKLKGNLEYSLAHQRSLQSSDKAAMLQDFTYNAMQAGGTILTNLAKASDNNPNSGVGKFLLGGSSKPGSISSGGAKYDAGN